MRRTFTREELAGLVPQHDTLVGVDSDGCVFDTMELKQKRCFHGLIVSHWRMDPAEQAVRETAEFVNLYSKWRGSNRFVALLKTFELLSRRADVKAAGVPVPLLKDLAGLASSGAPLSNTTLAEAADRTGSVELASVLDWSRTVNELIEQTVTDAPPFPHARESLEKIRLRSDAICVSQTPEEALVREWEKHGLLDCVRVIAGQELGSKAEHIAMAAGGRYGPSRVLMIGDALGDLDAAKQNGGLFYPINPKGEAESWRIFHDEAYDRFLDGAYAGDYEQRLISRFRALLPDSPPWTERNTR